MNDELIFSDDELRTIERVIFKFLEMHIHADYDAEEIAEKINNYFEKRDFYQRSAKANEKNIR